MEEIDELRQKVADLEEQLSKFEDKLLRCSVTGLYNQLYFLEYMQDEVKHSFELQIENGLILIEIDNVSKLRHDYGFSEMNEILQNLVYVTNQFKHKSHLLFKLEGASFGLYVPFSNLEQVIKIADALNQAIKCSDVFIEPITVSMGVSVFSEFNQGEAEGNILKYIYRETQLRLQAAKSIGSNVVANSEDHMNQKPTVLIIDPDPYLYRIMVNQPRLKYLKFELIGNGISAIESIEKSLPHLVISEVMLPKMDGFLVRERMQESSKLAKIPFVLVSNKKDNDSVNRANHLKIDFYFKKPVYINELSNLIESLINS